MRNKLSKFFILTIGCQLLFTTYSGAQIGTWTQLKNNPLHSNEGICLLLTNGTVICHNVHGGAYGTGWDRLTPDIHGSYINGTWDTIASMENSRLFFSTQVLPSGKVYVAGGEYGPGGTGGEVYDPVTNSWTECGPIPSGWNIYDGNSQLLYDGTVLEGPQISTSYGYNNLIWSPITNNYTVGPNSLYDHDEAEWLKLPDSSILFVGIGSQNSNRYIPQTGKWVNDGNTPGELYDYYGEESGCAFMLPNGKAVFFGATPYNAIYTPSGNSSPGTWASIDSFPTIRGTHVGQTDAPGAMMVNGHILLTVSPVGTSSTSEFNSPAYFVEYNYVTNTFTQVKAILPKIGGDSIAYISGENTQMLDLPDGTVLVSISQTRSTANNYYIYTPGSGPIAQGKPTINNIIPESCSFYKITGKLFNGISEGAAFGDDWQCSTNYPLVRLTNSAGNVYYAKTTNWNRIGAVQTDSLEDTAYFSLANIPGGTYSLVVVVNGFASNPTVLTTAGVVIASQTNVSHCYGETNGSATALASNGVTPYTYLWEPGGETNATISNLSAGIYTVTVTDSSGVCAMALATILQPRALSITPTKSWVGCSSGDNGGNLVANAHGGTPPYTYLWSGGGGTKATAAGLSAGTYTLSVSDSCGALKTASLTITQPPAMSISKSSKSDNGTGNGIASVKVTGGTPPYIYYWTPVGTTTATAGGLSPGIYCCSVTDVNNCIDSVCITVNSSTGIENISGNSSNIHIYPDPNTGYFTVAGVLQGQLIELYNYLGQKISSTVANNATMQFNIATEPNGIYLVRILNKDGSLVTQNKIVKTQ